MRNSVVVWDPSGDLPEGEVLVDNAIGVARSRGVVLLPLDTDELQRGGVSGWNKRCYGRGWRYGAIVAARGCPLVLHVGAGFSSIEWCARLVRDLPGGDEPAPIVGMLRMAADTAQVGAGAAGLAAELGAVQLSELGAPDSGGGWIVGGRSRASITGDMFLALQLYGQIGGAKIVWFAASQSR